MKKHVCGLFILLTLFLSACATQQLASTARNTPKNFSENRLYYMTNTVTPVTENGKTIHYTHIDQKPDSPNDADAIVPNSPLSVVLHNVFVPGGGTKTRDIAVVLTIQTTTDNSLKNIVVDYQRDVPPGQLLNLKNILVFNEPLLDVTNPPYFKLQVIDVTKEDNERVSKLLKASVESAAQFRELIAYPGVIPGLSIAASAADIILETANANEVLLEMELMFYFQEHIAQAGGADLSQLKRGSWLVVGKPNRDRDNNPTNVEFWKRDFVIDNDYSKALYTKDPATGELILSDEIPYIQMTMLTADIKVPSFIMEKGKMLTDALTSRSGQANPEMIVQQAEVLKESAEAYSYHYNLLRYRNKKSIQRLIDYGHGKENPVDANGNALTQENITPRNKTLLLSILNRLTAKNFTDFESASNWWWNEKGNEGCLNARDFTYTMQPCQ